MLPPELRANLQADWATVASMVVVVLVALVALRLLRMAGRGIARGIVQREKDAGSRESAQKAKTLSQVVETTGRILIFTIAGLTLLSLVGKDVTPLLASAGIAGVAIGLGAQNLIKDWLAGFFILLENQYSIDDVIKVGEHSGVVEKLDLRRTVLRSAEGSAITIPNGEVRAVTNLTKEWSRAVVDVNVPYEEDLDRVMASLERVAAELAAEDATGKLILEPPEVLGIEAFGPYYVTLRVSVKTRAAKQWAVARALRLRIKRMLDQEGIQIPYPRQVSLSPPPPPETSTSLASLPVQPQRSE